MVMDVMIIQLAAFNRRSFHFLFRVTYDSSNANIPSAPC